MKFNEKLS